MEKVIRKSYSTNYILKEENNFQKDSADLDIENWIFKKSEGVRSNWCQKFICYKMSVGMYLFFCQMLCLKFHHCGHSIDS